MSEHGTTNGRSPRGVELSDPPHEVYDALADLFLGEADEIESEPTTRPLRTEGLILGHLPVFASAWVTQYARHRARVGRAPVALLRVYAGHTSIELIGDTNHGNGPHTRLESAIAEASDRADRWLVRVDDTAEPALAENQRLDDLTMLTGADEAAVVASYRTIKSLLTPKDGDEPRALRVAIMGAGDAQAQIASSKLSRAAEAFLGRSVEVEVCAGKVTPGAARTLYRGASEHSLDELLDMIAQSGVGREPARIEEPSGAPLPALKPIGDAPEDGRVEDEPPQPPLTPQESTHIPEHELLRDPVIAAEIGLRIEPGPEQSSGATFFSDGPTPREPAADSGLGFLADHIVGVRSIPSRCPYACDVELAIGACGRLHLLARAGGPAGRRQAACVEQLMIVASWARDHAPILREAHGAIDARQPVLHLFTDDAKKIRRLLDADVRVHCLAPIRDHGRTLWACVDLN